MVTLLVTLSDPNPSNQRNFYIFRCRAYLCCGWTMNIDTSNLVWGWL